MRLTAADGRAETETNNYLKVYSLYNSIHEFIQRIWNHIKKDFMHFWCSKMLFIKKERSNKAININISMKL